MWNASSMWDASKVKWYSAAVALLLGMTLALGTSRAGDRPPWQTPPLVRLVDAREGATGKPIPWRKMLDQLAEAEFVFLGEFHTDETTHRVELAVFRELAKRRGGKVVLAMEMFERDVQGTLDQYLAGKIDETAFRRQARVWGNYGSGYRPLIEFAKREQLPVVASNFPRPLLRQVAGGGEEAWQKLRQESPQLVPQQVLAQSKDYWRRVDNAIRGHLEMMRLPTDPEARRFSTQSLWDNTMAESCIDAAKRNAGSLVLHVNGGFHSSYHDGTVRQLKLRLPEAKVRTVAIVPTLHPAAAEMRGRPSADYVLYVESRARDQDQGRWGVTVGQDRKFRLSVPKEANEQNRVPLLIWLGDDGLTAEDGMVLLKSRFGGGAAIAVLEPTYRQTELDGSAGGRWFYPDSFSSDLGSATGAVERVWGYVSRRYPIAPDRVVVAGEGTGATVVVGVAAGTDRMSGTFLASFPKQYSKLKDLPLPLKELWGDDPMPQRKLHVVAAASQRSWWESELGAYGKEGIGTALETVEPEQVDRDRVLEQRLPDWLGFPKRQSAAEDGGVLVVQAATPRAGFWARIQALRHRDATGKQLRVSSAAVESKPVWEPRITVEVASSPGAVPRCPGPFGGTTVLVLDPAAGDEVRSAWLKLEEHDPLAAHSRFHRLRIVTGQPGRTLGEVLKKLDSERRRNVLIVPAVFAASPDQIWKLKQAAAQWEDAMTLQWLPGLGGQRIDGMLKPRD